MKNTIFNAITNIRIRKMIKITLFMIIYNVRQDDFLGSYHAMNFILCVYVKECRFVYVLCLACCCCCKYYFEWTNDEMKIQLCITHTRRIERENIQKTERIYDISQINKFVKIKRKWRWINFTNLIPSQVWIFHLFWLSQWLHSHRTFS